MQFFIIIWVGSCKCLIFRRLHDWSLSCIKVIILLVTILIVITLLIITLLVITLVVITLLLIFVYRLITSFIMEKKPFVFGIATSGDNFTDRKKETERLITNFRHGVNTILISPRRWGKTSLVNKACRLAQSDKLKIVYLDIFAIRSEREFYDVFASAVLKQTSSKLEEIMENAKSFLSRINPKITISSDYISDITLKLDVNPKSEDVNEILQLPEKLAQKKGVRIVICIDEFQQISEFEDSKTFQKRLRTIWQHQSSVSYCLFGSKKHLMHELFEKKSLPFYKFGDAIYLNKISTQDWISYICERFEATGKNISAELAEKVCNTVDNHSSYVQQFAWLLWIQTKKKATEQNFNDAYQDLINQNTALFEKQTENLSAYQMNFLRALVEGVKSEFTKQEILQKYELGSSANVSILKKALIKKELRETQEKNIVLADPVLGLWMKREFYK